MTLRSAFVITILATLAGCGGDTSLWIGNGPLPVPVREPFIVWGSSAGERVVDADNEAYAFYANDGCLYNFRTGRENRDFCLTPGREAVRYGALRMRVVNVLSQANSCIAALVEESTGNIVDIEPDAYQREVVAVTAIRPGPCS
jgi:hypothetical protein